MKVLHLPFFCVLNYTQFFFNWFSSLQWTDHFNANDYMKNSQQRELNYTREVCYESRAFWRWPAIKQKHCTHYHKLVIRSNLLYSNVDSKKLFDIVLIANTDTRINIQNFAHPKSWSLFQSYFSLTHCCTHHIHSSKNI